MLLRKSSWRRNSHLPIASKLHRCVSATERLWPRRSIGAPDALGHLHIQSPAYPPFCAHSASGSSRRFHTLFRLLDPLVAGLVHQRPRQLLRDEWSGDCSALCRTYPNEISADRRAAGSPAGVRTLAPCCSQAETTTTPGPARHEASNSTPRALWTGADPHKDLRNGR